jgi:hypothetical protein
VQSGEIAQRSKDMLSGHWHTGCQCLQLNALTAAIIHLWCSQAPAAALLLVKAYTTCIL